MKVATVAAHQRSIVGKRGIFAASAALRHSTVRVTRKYYVSSKIEPTSYFVIEKEAASDPLQLLDQLKSALLRAEGRSG
ncbi:MAG: hypothetical protein JSR48_05255 [Verrucomicrobia bacterium]|nr:hypothetical protein [Verrucomicrobiota bacterium]